MKRKDVVHFKAAENLPDLLKKIRKLPYQEQKRYSHVTDYYILQTFLSILTFIEKLYKSEDIKADISIRTELDFFKGSMLMKLAM